MNSNPSGSGPFCEHLRSKKYFFLQAPAQKAEEYIDASNHCWCCLSMQVVGPDGGFVHPEHCGSQRSCYQPHEEVVT